MWTEWTYHDPNLVHEPPPGASWAGHRRFGYDLVRNLKPKRIVELGTCWGISFFAFCQAVDEAALSTELWAVDTWEGDDNTGRYGPEIFEGFTRVRRHQFPMLDVRVSKTTFDEARRGFAPASIDLLHIDGCHSYEAVRHDFETWRDAVTDDGVVLFHDTAVRENAFGVYRLWDELKARFAFAEFEHSYGLGVLFMGGDPPGFPALREEWHRRYAG